VSHSAIPQATVTDSDVLLLRACCRAASTGAAGDVRRLCCIPYNSPSGAIPMTLRWQIPGRLAAVATTIMLAACGAGPQEESADLVLRNGEIVTVDPAQPTAEAVAVRDGRIIAVGTNAEIGRYVGRNTEVVDLEGRLAIPGFIEGHGHFMGVGQAKMNLDLMNVRNWDEVVQMVKAASADAPQGAWIIGRGWHQEKWDRVPEPNVQGIPLHTSLDSVAPNNPVLLTHASGHMSFANKRALELAGIDRNTPDPAGGEILRDAQGNATGLLRQRVWRRERVRRRTDSARRPTVKRRCVVPSSLRGRKPCPRASPASMMQALHTNW
jgi:hypothetical protein